MEGRVEQQTEELSLSLDTLEALKCFALERGIDTGTDDENVAENPAQALLQSVQAAMTAGEEDEEIFEYVYDSITTEPEVRIQLEGVRKDIGQTLDSTGLTIWRAAETLSDFLYHNPHLVQGKRVLEVGAGLGLCGLVIAKKCKQLVISDGDDLTLERLRRNCTRNSVPEEVCRHLYWETDDQVSEKDISLDRHSFDVVIGADIIYEEQAVVPLFQTVRRYLASTESATFILAFTKRNVSIDFVLDVAKKCGFVSTLPEGDSIEGIYYFKKQA